MGACVSSSSSDGQARVRVYLAGCPGASLQSVVQQLVGVDKLRMSGVSRRASALSQSFQVRSSSSCGTPTTTRSSLRNSLMLRGSILRRQPAEEEEREEEHRFDLEDIPFTLFRPACLTPTTFAAKPLQRKRLQARVGKVDMVLFVVPLTWYDEEMPVEEDPSKHGAQHQQPPPKNEMVNRMEFALAQFRAICKVFANTEAGVAVILEDWEGLVEKVTTPESDDISDHFLDYPEKDEGNPAAAARYFAKLFQEVYSTQSAWNNCYVHVVRPDKRHSDNNNGSSSSKKFKNEVSRFLFDSAKALMMSYQVRSLLMGDDSESGNVSKRALPQYPSDVKKNNNNNTDKQSKNSSSRSSNGKNVHWMSAPKLNESTTSITTTEDYSTNNTSSSSIKRVTNGDGSSSSRSITLPLEEVAAQ